MDNTKTSSHNNKQYGSNDALGSLLVLGYSCFAFSQPTEFSHIESIQSLLNKNNLDISCLPQFPEDYHTLDEDIKLLKEDAIASDYDDNTSFEQGGSSIETLPEGADSHEEDRQLHVLGADDFLRNDVSAEKIELPDILKAQETGSPYIENGEANYGGTYVMPDDEGEKSFAEYTTVENSENDVEQSHDEEYDGISEIFINMGKIITFLE